jgi:unsaturated rhamnogalacturonyl hydrolase
MFISLTEIMMKISTPNFRRLAFLLCGILLTASTFAQDIPWSRRMTDSFIARHKDSILVGKQTKTRWDYEQGLMLKAIEKVWYRTGEGKYFDYIRKDIDQYVNKDGSIRSYKFDDFNIDNIPPGRALLTLYQQTLPDKEKYKKAADLLWKQLEEQPRTKEGGFWHKKRYPNQMWLDGLFMGEPFAAEYSKIFNHPEHFDDIAKQFELIEKYAVDEKTGLVYHAYDESREQQWADKKTGRSPHFWGRAIGWYAIAIVDVLDYFPEDHPKRAQLISYIKRLAPVLAKYQDKSSGVWYQIVDQGNREGNYFEASASCMFVYALAKASRLGYIPETYAATAKKGFDGIIKNFVEVEADGLVSLDKTVSVGGLGGNPYRDGTYEYYLSEPIRKNDLKGIGPFIFASIEMEIAKENTVGKGKTVGLDYHFNREFRKDLNGQQEQFHYTWEDRFHSGFWLWGNTFRELGAKTVSVPAPPTAENLKNLSVYIIVDPDTKKETANPNFVQPKDISAIEKWVKAGGVLVLMANDTANCEIPRFNQLAKVFGIQFSNKNRNMVQGTQFEQGRLDIPKGDPIFKTASKIYIKELSPLILTLPAKSGLTDQGDIIFGISKYGKGTVFAVGDPWLYNEYTDGRRIDTSFENFEAGKDLANWLLKQAAK